jgi:hypothetical protein
MCHKFTFVNSDAGAHASSTPSSDFPADNGASSTTTTTTTTSATTATVAMPPPGGWPRCRDQLLNERFVGSRGTTKYMSPVQPPDC